MRAIVIAILLLAGCKKENPFYCEGNENDLCPPDDGGADAPIPCSATKPCATGQCKEPPGVCVPCLENSHCMADKPICTMNACEKCTAHSQCESKVCRFDGKCEMEALVAYVNGTTGTDAAPCGKSAACKTLSFAAMQNKGTLKVEGAVSEPNGVSFDVMDTFTIYADPMASLVRSTDGTLIDVRDSADIKIYGLTIRGTGNTTGVQMANSAKVLLDRVRLVDHRLRAVVTTGGALTLLRSTIMDNLGSSSGGVLVSGGTFVIVGNMFVNNGNNASQVGGVDLQTGDSATNRLEFNSFNRNDATGAKGKAINCTLGSFTARNNIVYANPVAGTTTQVIGCTHNYSLIDQTPAPAGMNIIGGDPLFINNPLGNLHIMGTSPARGMADPTTVLDDNTIDLDGNTRVSPADLGADEVP